jgi:hypothetical protein
MNENKRKAELQRKLAMPEVPRPPADLLARIKADIPSHLQAGDSPDRALSQPAAGRGDRWMWRSTTAMRVAASLILLVTTGLLTWRLLQSDVRPAPVSSTYEEPVVPAITRSLTRPSSERAEAPPVAEETAVPLEQPFTMAQKAEAPASAPDVPSASARGVEAPQRPEPAGGVTGSVASSAPESFVHDAMQEISVAGNDAVSQEAERITVTAEAPIVGMPPPAPPPPPVAPAPAPEAAASLRVGRADMAKTTVAPVAVRQASREIFGVSVDPAEFERVRRTLDRGQLPRSVDVEAIVNHFARPSADEARQEIITELSKAPLEGDRAILRISIDGGSSLEQAKLSVTFDASNVVETRRIGGSAPFEVPGSAPATSSVTVLYEVKLAPGLATDATVATVILGWPTKATLQKVPAGSVRSWTDASRRHRLASLAAVWAESLNAGSAGRPRIETLARELVKEDARDRAARELAAAVAASARLTH